VSNNDAENYDGVTARARLAPGETLACFRQRMIASTAERGDWNYFGTHICTLEQALVSGGAVGPRDGDIHDDPLIDAPVELVGKLVDIDPAGLCSQIFFDELSLGIAGRPHLHARPRRRMSDRWLNFGRNLSRLPIAGRASAAWQAVFPAADVEIVRAEESSLLASFADALRDPRVRGLMLRLSTYRTEYFQNGLKNSLEPAATLADLQRLHEQGKPVSNPAYSLVVGAVGVWLDGDSEAVPGGRQLFGQSPAPVSNAGGQLARAGPAAAEFHPAARVLSLDLSNTIPELDQNVEKADFGPLAVVMTKDGNSTELARIEYSTYDRAAYQARAGIVDVDVSAHPDIASQAAGGALTLSVDTPAGRTVLLAERELSAFCDECNVYLDQDESRTLVIYARERGEIPTRPLSILVAWYDAGMRFTGEMTVLPVSVDGAAELEIRGDEAGYRHVRFTTFAGDAAPIPPAELVIATEQFSSVRTLPFDDALQAATSDEELTWEFVYSNILVTYDAIAPRMSTIIDLSDADAVRTFARRLKEVTAPELFESRRYMPVTRDLSRGKRELLHRFCDLTLTTSPTTTGLAASRLGGKPETREPPARERLPGAPVGEPFDKRAFS
ncbi:MAG: hypothetical protein M3308_03670, partial [Actinomycetota bacterium]|nr:hypothetical protein [Actinomycetota bacterium]